MFDNLKYFAFDFQWLKNNVNKHIYFTFFNVFFQKQNYYFYQLNFEMKFRNVSLEINVYNV